MGNLRIRAFFAWYDMWVGAYIDRVNRRIYVCPLPCCVFVFERRSVLDQLPLVHGRCEFAPSYTACGRPRGRCEVAVERRLVTCPACLEEIPMVEA
ncbi:MAG: hypothetical protein AAGA48_22560 [Myxococcota bacterium]